MELVYLFVVNGAEWEDIIVFLSKEEAIEKSKQCPKVRLEIFAKSPKGGLRPTYNYYLDGVYFESI
jgi:hypothetical protein